jgi:hypothetical protein
MGQIVGFETLVLNLNQTPGSYPKEDNLNTLMFVKNDERTLDLSVSGFLLAG